MNAPSLIMSIERSRLDSLGISVLRWHTNFYAAALAMKTDALALILVLIFAKLVLFYLCLKVHLGMAVNQVTVPQHLCTDRLHLYYWRVNQLKHC